MDLDKRRSEVNNPKRLNKVAAVVEMAVAAVTGDANVMDIPMSGFDTSPNALDVDLAGETQVRSDPRSKRPTVDVCGGCAHVGTLA
jgi:hypothetical protein